MPIETISRPFVGLPRQESFIQRLAGRLYRLSHKLGDGGVPIAVGNTVANSVTLVCISDTHNTRPSPLPLGDILLHAGDLSQFGTFAEIQAQLSWLAEQPHPHKVVIAGNHDLLLDTAFVTTHPDRELDRHPGQHTSDLDWGDVCYLDHEMVDLAIEGKGRSVRIFGSPWTPCCGSWAFQYKDEQANTEVFNWKGAVPNGTDVMLVHGPPKGHLDDGGRGCSRLLTELWRAKPKVVVCGHIHASRGRNGFRLVGLNFCMRMLYLERDNGHLSQP